MSGVRATVTALAALAIACDGAGGLPTSVPGPTLLAPAGLSEINEQSWDALSAGGWSYLRRTGAKDDDIVDDPSAPVSPDRVLRIIFTPGMPRDTEPGVHWIGLPRSREVHAAWWIKLSPNWAGSPAGACKMTFLWTSPNRAGQVYTALYRSEPPHHVGINTEWAPYGQKVWEPNLARTPIEYGRWHRIDWYARWATSPDAADGVMRWWVDGVLNGNHIDVRFPPDGTGFQQFEFAPTVQIPPSAEQYIYIDHSFVRAR
jgi:hypothetical protein